MNGNEQRNYRILGTIASGGTAVIYKAIQTSLDRPVVVKRLHPHLTGDAQFTRRFEMEAKAAASLDHENIVRIIDFGSTHGEYYIVMDFIEGRNLGEIIERHGPIDPDLALLLAREICLGLDHAHQRGIIHRDVKPANIMVSNDGAVKITDFGLAKLHQAQLRQTVASTLLGTPLYMSPEQATGDNIDGRSDIFSLGTVLYEMMTGVQPFLAENHAAVISNITGETPRRPSGIVAAIGSAADEVVMKALEREPGRRYRTALEMARAIETALGPEQLVGSRDRLRRLVTGWREPQSDRIRPARPKKRPRRKRGRFAPAAIAACLALAGAYLLWSDPGRLATLRERVAALRAPDPGEAAPNLLIAGPEAFPSAGTAVIPADPPPGDTTGGGADTPDTTIARPAASAAGKNVEKPDVGLSGKIDGPPPAEELETEPAANEPPAKPAAEPAPAVGLLEIVLDEAAAIIVDGEIIARGRGVGPVEIPAGEHELVCRTEGFREYRERILVTRGELSRRRIDLERITGQIALSTLPGVQVYVDDVLEGTTPLAGFLVLPAGAHKVELKKAGFGTWSQGVYVAPDETMQLRIQLVPARD